MISVIIPVYNVADYLRNCVESVMTQTFADIEIVLVDDGSTDGSEAICDALAKEDSRIRVFHQKNGGVSAARNMGLKLAKGDYICFVDSDDIVDADLLDFLYDMLHRNGADVVSCNFHGWEDPKYDGVTFCYGSDEALGIYCKTKKEVPHFVITQFNVLCSKLYRRELFEGLEFPVGRQCEDMIMNAWIFSRIEKLVVCNDAKYHYIQREGSIMHSAKSRYYHLAGLFMQYDICIKRGIIKEYPLKGLKTAIRLIDHSIYEVDGETRKLYIQEALVYMMMYDDRKLPLWLDMRRNLILNCFPVYAGMQRLWHSFKKKK